MAQTIDLLFLAGRLILGAYFLTAAWSHVSNAKMMIGYAASKGVPAPALAVYGSGALLLAGSLSLLTGLYTPIGLALLALFFIGVTPAMHAFWKVADPMQKMGEQVNFMKNAALLGALLALYAVPGPWAYSIAL